MTTREIAKTCMTIATALGLKPEQHTQFGTYMMTMCLFDDEIPQMEEKRTEIVSIPEPKKETKKRIEKMVKTANAPAAKLLCRAGAKCHCHTCKKDIYKVSSDVYDGLKAEEFAACFAPTGHTKSFPTPIRIRAVDGCVMTDCPVCEGDMSLVLWGKKPEKDFDDGDVGSVGGVSE